MHAKAASSLLLLISVYLSVLGAVPTGPNQISETAQPLLANSTAPAASFSDGSPGIISAQGLSFVDSSCREFAFSGASKHLFSECQCLHHPSSETNNVRRIFMALLGPCMKNALTS
jgi:hypothetical protein